jgi:hypothetical protein
MQMYNSLGLHFQIITAEVLNRWFFSKDCITAHLPNNYYHIKMWGIVILVHIYTVASYDPLYDWVHDSYIEGLQPKPRGGHTAVTIDRSLYIFGGCDGRI